MNTTLVILMFSIFFIVAFMDVPLAFVMGLAGTLPIMLTKSASPMMTVSAILSGMDSFTLLACPFFILSGNLMVSGGLAKKLVNFANSLVGNIRGGLAMVCVIACHSKVYYVYYRQENCQQNKYSSFCAQHKFSYCFIHTPSPSCSLVSSHI